MGCFVGVWVDAAEDPEVSGFVPPSPVEVEAPWVGIEFNPGPSGGCSFEDFGNIHGIGFTLEQKASSRMAQAGDMFVLHGADDTIGHLFFVRAKAGMDGGDDVIEFGKEGIGEIEFSAF